MMFYIDSITLSFLLPEVDSSGTLSGEAYGFDRFECNRFRFGAERNEAGSSLDV